MDYLINLYEQSVELKIFVISFSSLLALIGLYAFIYKPIKLFLVKKESINRYSFLCVSLNWLLCINFIVSIACFNNWLYNLYPKQKLHHITQQPYTGSDIPYLCISLLTFAYSLGAIWLVSCMIYTSTALDKRTYKR
jgi:hypothetical protein